LCCASAGHVEEVVDVRIVVVLSGGVVVNGRMLGALPALAQLRGRRLEVVDATVVSGGLEQRVSRLTIDGSAVTSLGTAPG
jgi:hypothetical protein